ncbi:HNH endonuclease [Priestia sp. BR_2]
MTLVILQPAGTDTSEFNFNSTMKKTVSLDKIAKYDKAYGEYLSNIYKDGGAPTWGVTPAKNKSNAKKWERVNRGDVVFFYAQKRYFATAVVTGKLHCKSLALDLWGWKDRNEGVTWEYIYFLDELKFINISLNDMNKLIDYTKDKFLQGFTVLSQEKSNEVLNIYEYESDTYVPSYDFDSYRNALSKFQSGQPLDAEGKALRRAEQGFLRQHLFGSSLTGYCGVCGEELPVNLLVAAHIKKRAECTPEEKLDVFNIVMPMCKLGCDDLYERGYISVKDGEIVVNEQKYLTSSLKVYIEKINKKLCLHWSEESLKYFEWHNNKHGFSY